MKNFNIHKHKTLEFVSSFFSGFPKIVINVFIDI